MGTVNASLLMEGDEMSEKMIKEITDLALTSFLLAIDYKLQSFGPNGKKFSFFFENSETLNRDILAYYNRTARVDPLTFAEIFRNLKALTFQN
jgi:hypothetical protein